MGQPSSPDDDQETPHPIDLRGTRLRLRSTVEADRAKLIALRQTPEISARWRGDDLEAEFDELLDDDEE
ncbi:MAG: hypothetical protein AAFO29_02785, partial [Actinomycetota bacterium]